MKKLIASGAVAGLVAMLTASVVFADTLSEAGDAGDLPATAQVASGAGLLTSIDGAISGNTDEDMYKICLQGNRSFAASTVNAATLDTQLYLFDSEGLGVYMNDDFPGGPLSTPCFRQATTLTPTDAG